MTNHEPKVAVIILNWNRYRDTVECLDSVLKLQYSNYQIILLDNGSDDGSAEKIIAWTKNRLKERMKPDDQNENIATYNINKYDDDKPLKSKIIILKSNKNLGFAEGNNQSVEFVLRKLDCINLFFLLNNDTILEKDSLKNAVKAMREKKASIIGFVVKDIHGKVIFSRDNRVPELFYVRNNVCQQELEKDEISTTVQGCAMLIQKRTILDQKRKKGYFLNKKLFLYGEETDFCLRVKKTGGSIYVVKNAIVYHKISQSLNIDQKEAIKIYYTTRNTMFIAISLFRGFWLIFFHFYYPLIRLKVVIQKIIYNNLKEAKALLKGLYDGYRGKGGEWKELRKNKI